MKLVIDIPDREYKQRIEFRQCYDSTIDKAIVNGTPFEEELRKLWIQIYNIEELDHDFEGFYHCQNEVLELINKMKGE